MQYRAPDARSVIGSRRQRIESCLEHWDFYVLSTTVLDDALGDQKSLGLTRLRTLTEPRRFDDVRATIDVLLDTH